MWQGSGIEEPKRAHGQHATDHTWRNARIAQAVETCRGAGLTLKDACELVADMPGTPASYQIEDIYKENRAAGGILDGISISISASRPPGA